jgi:uncharacterized membrane protein
LNALSLFLGEHPASFLTQRTNSRPMKYTCSVEINLPINKVLALWENEANFKEWQDGFKSIEHLTGTPNTKGATSRIILQDKQKIELLETIVVYNLPQEKTALYEHIHMTNSQTSRFEEINSKKTLYTSEVEYLQFNGIMIKIIARLFPSKFKAQSQKWMQQFKHFSESTI